MSTGIKAEQAEATRSSLVRVGRKLFARRGFDEVSAEEIVAAAQVTRGALYHHFEGGKEGLFRAVVADAMGEVKARLSRDAAGARSPLEAVELGIRSFLGICTEPGYQRVLLVDGPAVLGWREWRALDLEFGLGLLRRALEAAAKAGQIEVPDVETATHLLAGALIDGAMLIGRDRADASVRARVEETLFRLLRGLAGPPRDRASQ